ncbi:MAG: S41 family peptidase [Defluviitaleaceae bacterium]|nr:S41 family peptidase [Defluviitaleaceae bacterium]
MFRKNLEIKYKRLRIITILITIFTIWLIYTNYNYLVFKFLISYNYTDTTVLNEIYKEAIGEENFRSYFRNFDETVIAIYSNKLQEVGDDPYTFLYKPAEYDFARNYERDEARLAFIEEHEGNTVYIYIPNFSRHTNRFVQANVKKLEQYDNIIIDLCGNLGGSLSSMYQIANLFLERGDIIAKEETRHTLTSRIVKAEKNAKLEYGNIYILVDDKTASAAEGLTMALRENLDNVTVIGTQTFGKGVGQVTIPLKYGFATRATVLKMRTPSGGTINRVGVVPDK